MKYRIRIIFICIRTTRIHPIKHIIVYYLIRYHAKNNSFTIETESIKTNENI